MKKVWKILRSPWTIFAALIIGMIVGVLFPAFGNAQAVIGNIFIRLLRMGVVPLILVNVMFAIIGLGDAKKLASIGGKTIVLFLITTFCAALLGCIVAALMKPGVGFVFSEYTEAVDTKGSSLTDFFTNAIPVNIIEALSEGNMLQVVVFAVLAGIASLYLPEKYRTKVANGLDVTSKLLMKLLEGVLLVAPIGIFSLSCATMTSYGIDVLRPVAKLIIASYTAGIIQLLLVYPVLYFITTGNNPFHLLKLMPPVWITAFSTRSTNATLPVSLANSKERVGVSPSIADFVIPFGASCNCDGAAFFLGICVTFVSQSVGMNLTFWNLLSMALVGVLITLGNTGIPNSMFIMVPVMLSTFGLPLDFMSIMGVYPIIDSITTTCNVTGDNVVAAIIDANEKKKKRAQEAAE